MFSVRKIFTIDLVPSNYVFTGVEQFPGLSITIIMIEICLEGKFQTYTSLLCHEKVFFLPLAFGYTSMSIFTVNKTLEENNP